MLEATIFWDGNIGLSVDSFDQMMIILLRFLFLVPLHANSLPVALPLLSIIHCAFVLKLALTSTLKNFTELSNTVGTTNKPSVCHHNSYCYEFKWMCPPSDIDNSVQVPTTSPFFFSLHWIGGHAAEEAWFSFLLLDRSSWQTKPCQFAWRWCCRPWSCSGFHSRQRATHVFFLLEDGLLN